MKIEPGFYRTRNGRKARIFCTDAPGKYPVKGCVEGVELGVDWNATGKVFGVNHDYDLIEPWRDEPEPEKPVEVTLTQLREAIAHAVSLSAGGMKFNHDDALAYAGISVPRALQQPVRVSGWCVVHGNGHISGVYGDRYAAEANARAKSVVVYVTGTEGVGPGISSQGNEGEGQ